MILIVFFIAVSRGNLFTDNVLFQIYFYIIDIGLLVYPIFIVLFLIRTYKDEVIVVNKPVVVVLLNGVVLFILQFFVDTKYIGSEGYEYLLHFNFEFIMVVLYLPVVVLSFLYIANLFILDKEKK
jgi:hypothetical protein